MSLLDIQDLNSFYGDFQALFGIDFCLEDGETVAIIGANGAGKSTLFNLITVRFPQTSGNTILYGQG